MSRRGPKRAVRRGPRTARALVALCAAVPLAACSWFEEDERLPGDRVPVRQIAAEASGTQSVIERALPPAQPIGEWTQTGSNATHFGGNLAGPQTPAPVWSADAGDGSSSASFITAAPVVAGGLVFTLDAASEIRAFDAGSGAERWRTSLIPNERERGEQGFGGGVAAEGGRLFATTGFGEALALDAASGEILWRTAVSAPFRAAPAVAEGTVVAVTRASQAFGFSTATGEIRWRVQGVGAAAGFLGGASPAIASGGTVVPFASGELVALELATGRRFWGAVLTGGRRGLARASITDITGDPVLIGPLVITANQSGRMAALEARTGRRIWTREIGATRPIWAAGDTVFLISDRAELMRLDAATGDTLWSRQLPAYEDEEDREDAITYSGPILVSGRLLFTDTLGNLWSVDAMTGAGDPVADVPGGSATGPVVAGGTVFVLSENGVLHAYR